MRNVLLTQHLFHHPRLYGLNIGFLLALSGAFLALLLVLTGPIMTIGMLIAVSVGLIALSNLDAALLVLLLTTGLLPYGTLPFKIAITPSLIDMALAVFIGVYLCQWMTGRRLDFRTSPVHIVIWVFIVIMFGAFIFGLPNAPLTSSVLRRFAGLMGNIVLSLIVFDVVRHHITLRRVAGTFMLIGAIAGLIGIVLWALNDLTAEAILNRLGRLGYPVGGVLHYREDGVSVGNERAIGTWIDPNAYGGFLMMVGALTAPQLISRKPVLKSRLFTLAIFGCIALALFLSDSRGSMLGLAAGVGLVALLRDRRLIWLMIVGLALLLLLPVTQGYIDRLVAGFTGADLETQMRLGEYKDALRLIQRYPVLGVGFSAPPDIDLYLGFANTYLTIAANAGIVGLLAYLLTLASVFTYGIRHRAAVLLDEQGQDVWFGLAAGLVGAMVSSMFDHFYFNIEFQATSLTFWLYVGLFLAATRIATPIDEEEAIRMPNVPILSRVEPKPLADS